MKLSAKSKVLVSALALLSVSSSLSARGGRGDGSNAPGVVQVGLGWAIAAGGATITTDLPGSGSVDGVGARLNYGLRAQYGLTDDISAGIFVRAEKAVYAQTSDDFDSDNDITFTGTSFGLEGKYYIVNHERFNLYGALAGGYTTGDNSLEIGGVSAGDGKLDLSGMNYGFNVGFNWYWGSVIGMSLDMGYTGSSLSGTTAANGSSPAFKTTLANSGASFGFGLIGKFGGN